MFPSILISYFLNSLHMLVILVLEQLEKVETDCDNNIKDSGWKD